MKKSGFFAASMAAAASATAYSVSSSSSKSLSSHKERICCNEDEKSASTKSDFADKFAPRLDGLRFIETLVTAHR